MIPAGSQRIVDRLRLVVWMRSSRRVQRLRIGFVRSYMVGCSPAELAELSQIDSSQIARLGARILGLLGLTRGVPPIRLLCLGGAVGDRDVPRLIRECFHPSVSVNDPQQYTGLWIPKLRSAVIRWSENDPIQRTMVHELTHALLTTLSDGFPYPTAISEGFARQSEYLFCCKADRSSICRSHCGSASDGCLLDSEFMSVRDLIFLDVTGFTPESPSCFAKVRRSALWLNVFLGFIAPYSPKLSRVLEELWLDDLRTPQAVYDWLLASTGMGEQKLESHFHLFCTRGIQPTELSGAQGEGPTPLPWSVLSWP